MRLPGSVAFVACVSLAACSGEIGDEPAPLPASELDASADAPVLPPTDAASDASAAPDTAVDDASPEPTDGAPEVAPIDADPDDTPCRAELRAKGLVFDETAARGVEDAIRVKGPIQGVLFASGTDTKPMGDPIACEFGRVLVKFADLLKSKGFVRVGTLGSYCYRCCCSWSSTNFCRGIDDPEPDCGSSGYSNHSWGRAVDVRYLYKADGTRYDVNDPNHWVKYATTETCTKGIAAQTGISKELYALACEATSAKIFGVVLTPNYNSAHRNHFHMDVGKSGTPGSWTTKSWEPLVEPHYGTDDAVGYDDHCGE